MEQYLARFTLSFLMAQLFPGAVAVLSASCPYAAKQSVPAKTMMELFTSVGNLWFGSARNIVIFLFLSGATGLLIHGIAWPVMAWLENHDPLHPSSVRMSYGHTWNVGLQILLSPIKMILELLWTLTAPNLERLRLEENVPHIKAEDKPLFDFLQDFYLYFGEFYSHTSYALLFSFPFMFWTWATMGFTLRRATFLVLIYFCTSVFFLIGRIQYISLFNAEVTLVERANSSLGSDEVKTVKADDGAR